jgi:hypothetical protein
MSGPKCVDTRTTQLRMNRQMMEQLQRTLAATPLAITTDTVQIRTSQIDAIKEQNVARMQDKVEVKDTSALQGQLASNVTNDYTVSKLADWQPFDMSQLDGDPEVTLQKDVKDPVTGMVLKEDFFSSVLDACFAVVGTGEVDEQGEELVALAVDTSLLDDDGEWKDKNKKQVWDEAVKKVIAANRAADGPDRTAKTKQDNARLRAAMRAAGGEQQRVAPAAQSSEPAPAKAVEKPRSMKIGGGDD